MDPEAKTEPETEPDGDVAAELTAADWPVVVRSAAELSVTGPDSGPDDCVDGDESVDGGGTLDGDEVSDGEVDGEDGDAVGDSVDGHGEGVTPPLGVGVSVPVTVTHGTGDDGEVDGDVDVEAEVDGDVDGETVGGGGGGGVGLSCLPWSPCCRANQLSSWGSYTTKTFTTVTDGATTTTWEDW
ncbi:hypothetical protein ASE09_18180 [Streptomyces sp. Root66D1]|nr:hypothetical protein ASD33_14730 [Streptomyces sp. Root1304]KRA80055.1 hypothetical protein ASE09_18180 [Streptomyces sp. Root66D1]